jgi:hypothetical protein
VGILRKQAAGRDYDVSVFGIVLEASRIGKKILAKESEKGNMRNHKVSRNANAVVRKLESGNGNIKGMACLLPLENEALIPVTVIGISFHGYASNGVAVLVSPVGGYGTLSVGATELLDDTQAARDLYTARAKAAEYARNHTPRDGATDKQWREAVCRERASMTDTQRTAFDATAPKRFRGGQDMLAGIKEASSYTLKCLFSSAVVIRFGVDEDSAEDLE